MVRCLFVFVFLVSGFISRAQETVTQTDLKARYELPAGWKVQQYYKGDWDKSGGSSVCSCALAINILKLPNGNDFDYIHMVVYPSDKKGFVDSKRKQVWQYKVTHPEDGDTIRTPNLEWVRYQGKLTTGGENRFKDCIAWKYTAHVDKTYYTVYFWAKPALLQQYKAVIEKIMAGFRQA